MLTSGRAWWSLARWRRVAGRQPREERPDCFRLGWKPSYMGLGLAGSRPRSRPPVPPEPAVSGRVRLVNIHEIRCESGVVGQFPLFGGQLLRLLLCRRDLGLPTCCCPYIFGCAQGWPGTHGTACPVGLYAAAAACCAAVAFASRIAGVPACCASFCCAAASLVFQILNIVVGIVLNGGLRRLVPRRRLLAGVFLLVPLKTAATITSNAAPR